jgi:DNA-binding transcriptional ArsR family regulator
MSNSNNVEILKSLADETRLSVVRKLAHEGCEMLGSNLVVGCSEY